LAADKQLGKGASPLPFAGRYPFWTASFSDMYSPCLVILPLQLWLRQQAGAVLSLAPLCAAISIAGLVESLSRLKRAAEQRYAALQDSKSRNHFF